jgi:sortase A
MHEAKLEFVAMTQGDPAQAGDDQPGLVDVEGLYRFMQQENQRLYETGQSGLIDAWSYQEAGVDLSHYGIDDGCVGFITIARINVEIPIYLGANTANMDKGAVHLTETSYPIGGMNTNAVIAAHRGQVRWMFRDIDKLEVGDTVTITNFREQLTYRVVSYEVIDPHDSGKVHIQAGKDMITLISCHPLGSNYQRYVVYCERVP